MTRSFDAHLAGGAQLPELQLLVVSLRGELVSIGGECGFAVLGALWGSQQASFIIKEPEF